MAEHFFYLELMKRSCLLFIAFFILLLNPLFAQNDSLFHKEFVGFSNQISLNFSNYEDTINKQFVAELKKQWATFEVFQGKQKPIQPKPNHPIFADTTHKPTQPHLIPKVEMKPAIDPENIPDKSIRKNPIYIPKVENPSLPENKRPIVPVEIQKECYMIDFFGETIPLHYVKGDFQYNLNSLTNEEVANCWEKISQSYYSELIDSIINFQENHNLNDWGVFTVINEFSEKLNSTNSFHKSSILTVFILNQLGYDAKISFNQDRLFCMVHVDQQIYDVPFIELEDKIYYFLEYSNADKPFKSIKTYNSNFSNNPKSFNLFLLRPLVLNSSQIVKTVANDMGQNVIINLNKNVISFYKNYPQVDLIVYANASVSKEFQESIVSYFQPILKNKTQVESVSYILNFCQFQFDYANDRDQFGYEKPFFCEENFFYPKNDCEDRSIFFSFIVREILHQDIVLLHYPGHIATAVQIDDFVNGDYFLLNDKKYYICDPTYIGASIGMTMPQFQNVTPEIITLTK
jgi:hypothetical protein